MKKIQLFYDSISFWYALPSISGGVRGVKTAPERVFEGSGGDFEVELFA